MPEWFVMAGIIIATSAAIIASQALISSAITVVSEAIRLKRWPKMKINILPRQEVCYLFNMRQV